MAQLATEITVKEELRPAFVCKGSMTEDSFWSTDVLVHTNKTGAHGGFVVEDFDGCVFEVVPGTTHELVFSDGKFDEMYESVKRKED